MKRKIGLLGALTIAAYLPLSGLHGQTGPAQPAQASPCVADLSFQRLAFWVGDWDVYDSAGTKYATQRVSEVIDHCAIMVEWSSGGGNKGLGLLAFDRKTGAWKQEYVSNQVPYLSGVTLRTSDPSYTGPGIRFISFLDGGVENLVQSRVTIRPLSDHRAVQEFEESRDGGKTWKLVFTGEHRLRA